jgi:hypothetical protein
MQADELDTDHIRLAQTEVTRRAAARLRPYHLLLESVDLRTLQVIAPLAQAEVGHALVLQQEFLAAARQLEIVGKQADARRAEAAGLAAQFEALGPSLSPETLENLRVRAWDRLLQSPSTSVEVEAAGAPAILEVSP